MLADFYRNRRVLVTGDTGFKGSWLAYWLVQLGAKVQGLALPPITDPALFQVLGLSKRIAHQDIDVRDGVKLAACVAGFKPEIVFHLAAQPLVRLSYREPKATWDVNVGGTVNLLEALRQSPETRACVIITSDKCYDNREQIWGYRECDAMGGKDPYSASKGAVELLVASYRHSFFKTGMRLASARAGNVIGGGDWSADRIVTDFVTNIVANKPLTLRNPQAVRPWQHVFDPLSGYLQLGYELSGQLGADFAQGWNFGPAESSVTTVEHLARLLVGNWGAGRVAIEQDPKQVHEAGVLRLDCSQAAQLMKWRGVWNVEQAVAHTVAWYRSYYAGDHGSTIALAERQLATYIEDAKTLNLSWTAGHA